MGNMLSLVFLPAISFLSGLASLQIDPKSNKRWVLILVMAVSAIGSVVLAISDDKSRANQEKIVNGIDTLSQKIDATTQSTQTTVVNIAAILTKNGFTVEDANRVGQSLKADAAYKALLPEVQAANRADASTPAITYFLKGVDGPKVIDALREGGFKNVNPPQKGNPHNSELPTNAVWSGDPVTLEQAKFVALTLVRAGIGIRYIGRLEVEGNRKQNLIEIGSSQKHQNDPVLTVEAIEQMKSLP